MFGVYRRLNPHYIDSSSPLICNMFREISFAVAFNDASAMLFETVICEVIVFPIPTWVYRHHIDFCTLRRR